jgi:hypothetical protein
VLCGQLDHGWELASMLGEIRQQWAEVQGQDVMERSLDLIELLFSCHFFTIYWHISHPLHIKASTRMDIDT